MHTLHGSIGLARSRRHAASFSSATTYSTDDFPALTKEDLPARDSLEIVRKTIAHKRACRNLTAAAADSDDLPVLTPEDLPACDSLEFVRRTLAHKRERRNAALSAALPVVDAADVIGAEDTTFGYPLTRMGRRSAIDAADAISVDDNTFGSPLTRMGRRNPNEPWDYYIPHKDSLDLSRERAATREVVGKRRSLKQRVCLRVRAMVTDTGAALARAKSGSSLGGSTPG
jgi:hypothetical protein